MSKAPTIEQLDIAAQWLRVNEGDNGEAEACRIVAERLEREIASREDSAAIREAARQLGLPVAVVRSRLRKSVTVQTK